jgi:alkylation response protein AidB-like acyl-CoA dehydrogenase
VTMDFSWTEEQLSYKKAVIEFAQKELNQDMVERDKHGSFSRELWKKCALLVFKGFPVPEEYGGMNFDILTAMLTMEGLGYGCHDNGLVFGINAQLWSVQMPIMNFGTRGAKTEILARDVQWVS